MRFFLLSITLTFSSSSIFSCSVAANMLTTTIKDNAPTYLKSSAKLATVCAAALSGHYALEYISTFAHEHGHGIASGDKYTVTMIQNHNILEPWNGITHFTTDKKSFLKTFAGPLTGLTITYAQCIALTMLDGYLDDKTLSQSFYKGLNFPISFFTENI